MQLLFYENMNSSLKDFTIGREGLPGQGVAMATSWLCLCWQLSLLTQPAQAYVPRGLLFVSRQAEYI